MSELLLLKHKSQAKNKMKPKQPFEWPVKTEFYEYLQTRNMEIYAHATGIYVEW